MVIYILTLHVYLYHSISTIHIWIIWIYSSTLYTYRISMNISCCIPPHISSISTRCENFQVIVFMNLARSTAVIAPVVAIGPRPRGHRGDRRECLEPLQAGELRAMVRQLAGPRCFVPGWRDLVGAKGSRRERSSEQELWSWTSRNITLQEHTHRYRDWEQMRLIRRLSSSESILYV